MKKRRSKIVLMKLPKLEFFNYHYNQDKLKKVC
jgi:hypothetical protein